MTPGRFLRVWKVYSRTAALCHPMGGLLQLGVADQTPEGCRSTIELRFTTILDEGMPDRRKGEQPETTLLRDHGMQSRTLRKESKSSKVSLVSRV